MAKKQPALTPWYRGSIKPTRPGVYQREFPHCALYAEWTGYQWLIAARSPRTATKERLVSMQQDSIRWRGLAEKPQ